MKCKLYVKQSFPFEIYNFFFTFATRTNFHMSSQNKSSTNSAHSERYKLKIIEKYKI